MDMPAGLGAEETTMLKHARKLICMLLLLAIGGCATTKGASGTATGGECYVPEPQSGNYR
jgi:hypothetical protein